MIGKFMNDSSRVVIDGAHIGWVGFEEEATERTEGRAWKGD
jgi:hypothetical protein